MRILIRPARASDADVLTEMLVAAAYWRPDGQAGSVDEATPELSMAVAHAHRGRGVGRRLLAELIERAERADVPATCLSVDPDNPARRLYDRAGFCQVGSVDGSPTMVLRLPRREVGPRG